MSLIKPFLIAGVALLVLVSVAQGEHPSRVWMRKDGRVIVGALLHTDGKSVTLKLVDGRESVIPLEKLRETERDYLARLNAGGQPVKQGALPAMPAVTTIDPRVPVKGGPHSFVTPHFAFESDSRLTKDFVSEASRVFEGTLAAIEALPLGIVPKPAEGETKFRTRFMSRDAFVKEYNARQSNGSEARTGRPSVKNVGGVYVPRRKEVLVPFSSLGMTASASYVTLRGNNDLSTLTHEITHQVMHDWLTMMPVSFSEGLAEYLSLVPYRNGSFEFKNAADGLRKSLLEHHEIGANQPVTLPPPSALIEMGNSGWRGGKGDYLAAMMLVYYFIHLDQPDKPCETLAAYLHILKQSQQDTVQFIADYNGAVKAYKEKQQAYNQEIDAYNAALAKFRTDAAAFNGRIKQYNDQVRAGVARSQRVAVGAKPVPPEPPQALEVPAILKEKASDRIPADLLGMIQQKAKPALYRGREGAALDEAFRSAYQAMGIPVTYEMPGK